MNGHPSATGRAQVRESLPAKDRRSTAVPRDRPVVIAVVDSVCVNVYLQWWMLCVWTCIRSDLLLSKSDGIEVSYNACGVIANLMSDGAVAWTAVTPSRYKVLDRMVLAVKSWPLNQKRNINYRWLRTWLHLCQWTEPQVTCPS